MIAKIQYKSRSTVIPTTQHASVTDVGKGPGPLFSPKSTSVIDCIYVDSPGEPHPTITPCPKRKYKSQTVVVKLFYSVFLFCC